MAATELPKVNFDQQYQSLDVNMACKEANEAGDHSMMVERFTRRRWRDEARVPFSVAVADPHVTCTEGASLSAWAPCWFTAETALLRIGSAVGVDTLPAPSTELRIVRSSGSAGAPRRTLVTGPARRQGRGAAPGEGRTWDIRP